MNQHDWHEPYYDIVGTHPSGEPICVRKWRPVTLKRADDLARMGMADLLHRGHPPFDAAAATHAAKAGAHED